MNKILIFFIVIILITLLILFTTLISKDTFSYDSLKTSIKDEFQNTNTKSQMSLQNIDTIEEISHGNNYYYIGVGNKYLTYKNGKIRLTDIKGSNINYNKLFIIQKVNNNNYLLKHIYGFYLCIKHNEHTINNYNENFERFDNESEINDIGNIHELIGIINKADEESILNGIHSYPIFNISSEFKLSSLYGNGKRNVFLKKLQMKNKLSLCNESNASQFNIKHVILESGIPNDLQIIYKMRSINNKVTFGNIRIENGMKLNINRKGGNIIYNYQSNNETNNENVLGIINNLQITVNNNVKTLEQLSNELTTEPEDMTNFNDIQKTIYKTKKLYFYIVSKKHNKPLYFKIINENGNHRIGTVTNKNEADKFLFKKENFAGTGNYVNVLYVKYQNREIALSMNKQPFEYLNLFGRTRINNPSYYNIGIYLRVFGNQQGILSTAIRHAFELLKEGDYYRIKMVSGFSRNNTQYDAGEMFIRVDSNGTVGTQNYDSSYEELHIEPDIPKYDMTDKTVINYSICKSGSTIECVDHSSFIHSTYITSFPYIQKNSFSPMIVENKKVNNINISIKPELRNNNFILYSGENYTGNYIFIPINNNKNDYNLEELNNISNRSPSWSGGVDNRIKSIKFPENNTSEYQLYTYNNDGDMSIYYRNQRNINNTLSSLKFDTQEEREEMDLSNFILYEKEDYKGMSIKIPINTDIKKYNSLALNELAITNEKWKNNVNVVNNIKSIIIPNSSTKIFILYLFKLDNYEINDDNMSILNSKNKLNNKGINIGSLKFEEYIKNANLDSISRIKNNMANGRPCPTICKSNENNGKLYSSSTRGTINGEDANKICGGFLADGTCYDPNIIGFNLLDIITESQRTDDCRGCQLDFNQKVNEGDGEVDIFCPDKCFAAFKADKNNKGSNLELHGENIILTQDNRRSDGLCRHKLNLENNTCISNNSTQDMLNVSYNCNKCRVDDTRNREKRESNNIRGREKFQSSQLSQLNNNYVVDDVMGDVLARITTLYDDTLSIKREYIASLFDEYLYNPNSNVYNNRGISFIKSIKNTTSNKLIGLYYDILELPLITRLSIKTVNNVSINLNKIEIIDENNNNIMTSGRVIIDGIDESKLLENTALSSIMYDTGNVITSSEKDLTLNIKLKNIIKLSKVRIITEGDTASFNNLLLTLYSGDTVVKVNKLNAGMSSGTNKKIIEITLGNQNTNSNVEQFNRESYPYNVGLFANRARKPNFILGPQDEIDLETGKTNIKSRLINDKNESNLIGHYGLIKTSGTPHPNGTNVNGIIIENIPMECKYFNSNQRDCETIETGMSDMTLGGYSGDVGNSGIINRIDNGNRCRFVPKDYLKPINNSNNFTYPREREKQFHPTIAELGLYGVHPRDSVYGNYSPTFNEANNDGIGGMCFSTTNSRVPENGICTGMGSSMNIDNNCVNKTIGGASYNRHKEAQLIDLEYDNMVIARSRNLESSNNALRVADTMNNINDKMNKMIEMKNRNTMERIRKINCTYCNKVCEMVRNKNAPYEMTKNCDCNNLEKDCMGVKLEGFQNINNTSNNSSNNDNDNERIKRFESSYMNQSVSVNDIGSKDLYTINMNRKCLSVYGNKDYKLIKCNNNNSQHFLKKQINNRYDAQQFTGKKTTPQKDVKYPYNFLQSKTTNKCLQINDEGVSVEPCNPDNYKQHWRGYTSEKICTNER